MQRFTAIFAAVLVVVFGLSACAKTPQEQQLVDGTYTAEFKEFDSYGYKDFLNVTIEGGVVVKVEFDAKNADGQLRTIDEKYQANMEKTQDTNPKRYSADLTNQLLEKKSIAEVDDVAGATWSSECFKALYMALAEDNLLSGATETLLVDNVPEK